MNGSIPACSGRCWTTRGRLYEILTRALSYPWYCIEPLSWNKCFLFASVRWRFMSPSWLFRFHTEGLFCMSVWSRQKRKHQKLSLPQCFCSNFLFTVGRAARGAENLGQNKVTKLGHRQFSKRDQKSAVFGLLKFFRSAVKYLAFWKKIKRHNSLGRCNDYLKHFSDPTQPGKYHLSTFSSSWWESRCGIVLMLSECQWIVQLLDLPLFLKNIVFCHSGKLGEVGGHLDMHKPIISGGDIKLGGVPTSRLWFPRCLTNFMMADFSFTPPAQNTKFTEIYTDLHVPERSSLWENVLVIQLSSIMINQFQMWLRSDIFTAHRSRGFSFVGPLNCSGWKGLRSSSGRAFGSRQCLLWCQNKLPGALDSLFLKTLHFPHEKRTHFLTSSELLGTGTHIIMCLNRASGCI